MLIQAKTPFRILTNPLEFQLQEKSVINNYMVESLITKGGSSFIYSARNQYNHNKYIIKEFFPHQFACRKKNNAIIPLEKHSKVTFELGLKAIKNEALVLAELSEYDHYVDLIDSFNLNGSFYLVFKYDEGETLADFLTYNARLKQQEIESLSLFLLDALGEMHTKNILHRDLKPGNIFLSSNGPPYLLDFGSSLRHTSFNNSGFQCFRTHGYSPIELYDSRLSQGPWTDFFSLGATLFRCITGNNPISVIERKHTMEKGLPDPLKNLIDDYSSLYPNPLLQTINWMMAINPDDRPQLIKQIVDKIG